MNPLAKLLSVPRGGAGRALAVAALLATCLLGVLPAHATEPTKHTVKSTKHAARPVTHDAKAGAPAYYAAYEIPLPSGFTTDTASLTVQDMNDQGIALVQVSTNNGYLPGYVYLKDHYVALSTAGLNLSSATDYSPLHVSNTAADGSFNVSGEGNFADGFHRVIFWHVNADGTNTVQMMKNRVLPDGSQAPGEQQSANTCAVNSSGVIAGGVQSYLAGLGAFWYPPDTTPSSPFNVYQGPTDLDEAGNFSGANYANGTTVAQYNNADLALPANIDSRTYRLKNGRIAGEYVLSDNTDHTFVYDVTTSTFAELPVYDTTSTQSRNQNVDFLDDAGDAAGISYSPNYGSFVSGTTLWKKDPNTGAYTAYNVQQDLVVPVYTDYGIGLGVGYDSPIAALLADGSFVVNHVNNTYSGNANSAVVFKPGADLRPVINLPAGSTSSYILLRAEPGQPFSYQFTATNNPTAFTLKDDPYAGLPSNFTFNPTTGLLSGTPTGVAMYDFTVQATNGQGIGAHSVSVFLISGDAPVITSTDTANGKVGQAFNFQVTATNSPNNFSLDGLPDGLYCNYSTGLITGTPTKAGTFTVSETVSNVISGGFSFLSPGTGTLTITIQDADPTVTDLITSPATASGTVGKIFAYQITANFDNPTAYDAVGLPDGLNVNQSTGLISGQPTQFATGAHTVEIYASNDSHDASLTLTITVAAAPTNAGTADLTLTVTDSPDPVIVGGTVRYTFTLVNHGPDNATGLQGTFVKDSKMTLLGSASTPGVLVNGNALTFPLPDLASGLSETFVLAFSADAAGVYTVAAGAQADQTDPHTADNSLLATTEAKAGSTAAHAPVITAAPGGQVLQGDTFAYQVSTDGTVPVDSYTATGLPDGLSLNGSTGLISGTLAADAALGDFTVTLRVANGAGASTAMRTFTVVAVPDAPKLADVTGSFGDVKLKAKTDKGKYKLSGNFTLQNLGTKALNPTKKPLSVGVYLSASPTVSYPVAADPTSAGLLPLVVGGDPTTLTVSVSLPKAGVPVAPLVLPVGLGKAGSASSTLPLSVAATLKSTDIPAQVASGQYRYLVVVLDPAGTQKESHKANNVVTLDLQALFAQVQQ